MFKLLIALFKEPKAMSGAVGLITILGTGGYFLFNEIQAKHAMAMAKIEKNTDQVVTMVVQHEKILVTLQAIGSNLRDVKDDVKVTKNRMWQILLKTKKEDKNK